MKIQVINKSKHALPEYATGQSAGMDIRANLDEPIVLKPLQRCLVPTGDRKSTRLNSSHIL